MKEFEKWWGNLGTSTQTNSQMDNEDFAEFGWKAALRWSKAMHDVSSEPRYSVRMNEELKNE